MIFDRFEIFVIKYNILSFYSLTFLFYFIYFKMSFLFTFPMGKELISQVLER